MTKVWRYNRLLHFDQMSADLFSAGKDFPDIDARRHRPDLGGGYFLIAGLEGHLAHKNKFAEGIEQGDPALSGPGRMNAENRLGGGGIGPARGL